MYRMEQCLVFSRTNFDCDNLETFLNALGGGGKWTGRKEKGKENPYSCVVLAGARSTDERRDALQVRAHAARMPVTCTADLVYHSDVALLNAQQQSWELSTLGGV